MMKKASLCLLALLLLFAVFPVKAAETGTLTEAAITVSAPRGKATPNDMTAPVFNRFAYQKTVTVTGENSEETTETVTVEVPASAISLISCVWSDAEGNPVEKAFKAGAAYGVELKFSVTAEDEIVLSDTSAATVNGAKAILTAEQSETKTVFCVKATLTAEAGDLKPDARIFSEGEITRAYNGEATSIAVRIVEPVDGAEYSYQWVRGGETVEGATADRIEVKNVADSGAYSCRVKAKFGDQESEEVTTETVVAAIHPLEVTLILDDAEKNVGDPDPARFTFSLVPEVPDAIIGAAERTPGEVVGEYRISGGTLSFGEEVKENYTLLIRNGKFTIRGRESTAYAPADAIADESYIRGKNSARIKIGKSRESTPEGARFHLTPADESVVKAFSEKSGDSLLKSFDVSLIDTESREVALLEGAHLKVQIPLTEEEEKNVKYIYPAQYDAEKDELITYESVVETIGDTVYITFETERMLPSALLQSEAEVEHLEPGETPKEPTSVGPWIWAAVIIPAILAVGAILFTVFWNRRKNKPGNGGPAPTRRPAAPKAPAQPANPARPASAPQNTPASPAKPAAPPPAESEPPRKKRIVNFDDLDD